MADAAYERVKNALNKWKGDKIELDVIKVGTLIGGLVKNAGPMKVVRVTDINVMMATENKKPIDIKEAVMTGTKFFDAVYYFALEENSRPACKPGPLTGKPDAKLLSQTIDDLLYTALYLMIRGSYGLSTGTTVGKDIPAFIANTCGYTSPPYDVSARLASFTINKVDPVWIKTVPWSEFPAEIRQRLGLGLAGYRLMSPFRAFTVKEDASDEAKKAVEWVKDILSKPLDWALCSATRDPALVQRLGSFNKVLGNLILEAFSDDDIDTMCSPQIRMLFERPKRDPRFDQWKMWNPSKPLELKDPIGL